MGNFNTRNKFALGGILAIILIMLGVWQGFYFSDGIFDRPTTPTPTIIISPSKTIRSSSLPLKEIWRWNGHIYSFNSPSLLIVEGYLILATRDPDLQTRLIVLDKVKGNIVWNKSLHSSPYSYDFDSLYADEKRIYIGSLNFVQAFNLSDGELLWTGARQPWGRRGTFDVYYHEGVVEAYSSDYGLYILDPQTGETIEAIKYPEILMRVGETYYETNDPNQYVLKARNITTNSLLWSNTIQEKIQLWPIFRDDKMYLSLGADYGTDNREIIALSTETGEILWQSDGYVSNIAMGQNTLFAIRGDGAIIALNPKTGEQVGEITVEPAQTYQYKGTQHWGDYVVAASDKYVAVYYDDSQELIVFERTDVAR